MVKGEKTMPQVKLKKRIWNRMRRGKQLAVEPAGIGDPEKSVIKEQA